MPYTMPKEISRITDNIINGKDEHYSYSHFDCSNMADYTLLSTTAQDMAEVYNISVSQAIGIIQYLTH